MAKGDSGKITVNTNYFFGGNSIDKELSIPNSFYQSYCLDFRSVPSQISVLPAPRNLSNGLPGLITAMEQDLNGVRWGVDASGNIIQINTSNVLSVRATMTEAGSAGLYYNQVNDQLYIPGQTQVSMFGQVTSGNTGQPTFRSNQFGPSASTANGCCALYDSGDNLFDGASRNNANTFLAQGVTEATVTNGQIVTGSAATYSVPTTLSEGTGNFCFFSPDIEPFYSIWIYITAKGTGNWTLTLHDTLNTPLASVTVTNANLVNGYNKFKFTTPVRALVNASQTGNGGTYHFHLTSTVGDGTAGVINAADLSSVDFLLFANRLVTPHNGWHPTAMFTGSGVPYLCIGNGNYLSTYNFGNDANPTNGQWVRHQLSFKPGYEVCGLSANNQYIVIALERRSTNANRNVQDGQLAFWDGTTQNANFVIDIPMGSPYGLYTSNNVTYFACAGSLYAWSNGQTVLKVRKLAYQNTDYLGAVDSTIVNPNMFTNRYGLLMLGYPSSTTNPNISYGVWSWGSVELTFPNSYGLSYLLSPNTTIGMQNSGSLNLQIGCVYNFVDSMYISWQYTDSNSVVHCGMDVLDNFSTTAPTAYLSSLIWDGGVRYKQKLITKLKTSYISLPSGCTVTPWYQLNRGTVVTSTSPGVGGSSAALMDINTRAHEAQFGFTITTPSGSTTPPVVTGLTLEVDPLENEWEVTADG